jgi:inner membrane protein
MPSPISHSLMGYIIYRATATPGGAQSRHRLALYLLAANAPDLDFVPGLLMGDPNRYHHGISHSIGFAALFALVFSFSLVLAKRHAMGRNSAIFFSLYCSHIGLDYLSIDTTPPYGEPLLWPFSNRYYIAPFAFLPDIQRVSHSSLGFIVSLFSLHNLWAISVECLLLFPLILLVSRLRKKIVTVHVVYPF